MVEAVEEGGRTQLLWRPGVGELSRARTREDLWNFLLVPRPEGPTVTLFEWRLFGGGRGKISELRGRFDR